MNIAPPSAYVLGQKKTSDYYPFGMQMQGRKNDYSSASYSRGYNGMEYDKEPKNDQNSYTTEFRQYDPRLGRWLSLDPLMAEFPGQSPFCAMDNNPVSLTDPTGLSTKDWIGKKTKDGNLVEWSYDASVTSPDKLPEGYTEFAKVGSTFKASDGIYYRFLEGTISQITEVDHKAHNGIFEAGRYYALGEYGWEESTIVRIDAVPAETAATADFLARHMATETAQNNNEQELASLRRPLLEEQQRDLNYNYQMSQNIFGIMYQLSPASAVPDVAENLQKGSYYTAGGIALLEFTPVDEVSDIMRSNRKAFRAFKREFGPAGKNMDWQHMVEQNSTNVLRFGIDAIQHSNNLIRLDRTIHRKVTAHYNSLSLVDGFRLNRDYVNSLSFRDQAAYALKRIQEAQQW